MSIWFCLLIPIIAAAVMLKWFPQYLAWWEGVIPLVVCFIFIGVFKFTVEKVQVNDTEYHGSLIVEARYYEYWETYVHRTCTRTVSCGKNCTTTISYDCSYCDENPERWTVVNSLGNEYTVSKEFYYYLVKKWKDTPEFVELNRDIDHSGGCGKDGDMYRVNWNKEPMTAEATTTDHWYENRVQAAHTAFDFPDVNENDVKQYGLFEYPELSDISQETVLGLENVKWIRRSDIDTMKQWSKFLNGYLGVRKHARIYFLFFVDKPALSGNMQEAYWDGGNDNELVVCIGLSSKSKEIQWTRPFTWSPERKIIPDVREMVMGHKVFNPNYIAESVWSQVEKEYKRKDFREFSYVTVEPPTWAKWVTFFVTLAITIGVCWWAVVNEIDSHYDPLKEYFINRKNRGGYGY
jgi:hypothetical protein